MNRILCLILGLFCASPPMVPNAAQAQNATPAYWEGARNTGQGVCYQSAGSGVTLQSSSAAPCAFRAGLDLSRTNIVKNQSGSAQFPTPADTGLYEVLNPVSGNCASGTVTCSLNYVQVNESGAAGVNSASSLSDLMLNMLSGGSGVVGGRVTTDMKFQLNAPSGNTCPPCIQVNYSAFRSSSFASANDGGTSSTSPFTNGHSALFGGNLVATMLNGATAWNGLVGLEIDIEADTGSSMIDKDGLVIVLLTNDAVAGSRSSIGIGVTAANLSVPATAGFDYGYAIGSGSAADPVKTTGSLFGCQKRNNVAACNAHAYGINLLDFANFTTAAFASNGFAVDGTGNVTGAAFKVGAAAGVSCSGTPTASFASVGGIVTHC